jgi:hypothetical protein
LFERVRLFAVGRAEPDNYGLRQDSSLTLAIKHAARHAAADALRKKSFAARPKKERVARLVSR